VLDTSLTQTLRILAVDDDPAVGQLYRRILTPRPNSPVAGASLAGFEERLFGTPATDAPQNVPVDLDVVSQGDQAVEAVRAALAEGQPYAAVFLDVRMPPGPDGVWAAQEVRALDPRVEIVIVTAYSDVPPEDVCRRAPPAAQLMYLQKPFSPHEIRQLAGTLCERWLIRETESKRTREEIVRRLAAAAETRDSDTGMHIHRIGLSAALLAWASGWPPGEVDQIRVAALLHDVGKIGIPDHVLLKPARLNEEEMQIMRSHTEAGARLLDGSDVPVLQMARDIALHHHERWDGAGYPEGLAGEDIPESARIVAIIDVYDALVHDRVYRPAFPDEAALAMMQEGRGSQFDPVLFDRFTEQLPRFRELRDQTNADASLPPARIAV